MSVEVDKDVLESAKFIYDRHPDLKETFPFWKLLSLLDRYDKNLVYIKENGEIKGASIYVMIDDMGLERIKNFVYDIRKLYGIKEILKRDGDNLHFLFVAADDFKIILKGLRKVIKQKNPKTITWFKPDMSFHIIKGKK